MRWLLLFLAASVTVSDGYHILAIFPIPSKSHANLGFGFVRALLDAGHEVTYVASFLEKNTNVKLRQISVEETKRYIQDVNMGDRRASKGLSFVKEFSRNVTAAILENKEFKEIILKNKYDAVVTEWFFSDVQAGIAAVLQCPWIMLSTTHSHPYLEYLMGEINSPGIYPNMMLDYPLPMTFWQRLTNTFFTYFTLATTVYWDTPKTVVDYKNWFEPIARARGMTLPDFYEALYNVSVMFVNSHHSITIPHSLPENIVEIGGYHIAEEVPKLPEDMQAILDKSTKGVIYFSMGSVLKSAYFSDQTRKELLQIFGALPYTVLWKFEEELKDLPKNVYVRKWMPQPSILAHPNTRIFITHGGILSTLEAIHFGVPLIAIPVFGDQPINANNAVRKGFALKVEYGDNMTKELKEALDKMLKDDRYYKEAKRLSRLFRNRPTTPSKLIAHYSELAIETKGAYHLRSVAMLYPWYQRLMLDQLAFMIGVVVGMVFVIKRLLRICIKERSGKVKRN